MSSDQKFNRLLAFERRGKTVRFVALALAVLTFTACQQRMAHSPQYRPLDETDFYPDRRSSRPLEEGVIHRAQILDDNPLVSGLSAEGKKVQSVQIYNDDGTPREIKTGAGIPNKKANFVSEFPFKLEESDLQRGKERYQIYCVPCHGPLGNGRGKIVERGFLEPTSFHTRPVDAVEAAFRERQLRDNTMGLEKGKPLPLPLGISRGFSFYRDPETNANYRIPLRDVPPGYIFQVITKGYGGMPEYATQIPVADRWRIVAYVRALQLSQDKSETERALGGKK